MKSPAKFSRSTTQESERIRKKSRPVLSRRNQEHGNQKSYICTVRQVSPWAKGKAFVFTSVHSFGVFREPGRFSRQDRQRSRGALNPGNPFYLLVRCGSDTAIKIQERLSVRRRRASPFVSKRKARKLPLSDRTIFRTLLTAAATLRKTRTAGFCTTHKALPVISC